MSTQQIDRRFDQLLDSLKEFDEKADKLRRIGNFLRSAIDDAWKSSGQMNLIRYADLVVRMPIGEMNPMLVEISLDQKNLRARMRILNGGGNEVTESNITRLGLDFLMGNPSPMIDAAAKFCEGLGCLETFKGKVGRFCLMEYKL